MTANQINFARAKEERRHNRAVESVAGGTLSETVRHNTAQEGINWYTARNLAGLQAAQSSLAASQSGLAEAQSGLAQSDTGVKRGQLEEQKRHNIVSEIIQGVGTLVQAGSTVAKAVGGVKGLF